LNDSIVLGYCDYEGNYAFCNQILRNLGQVENDLPTLFILENLSKERKKYRMIIEENFSSKHVIEFYEAYVKGILKEYLISDPVPEMDHSKLI